MKTFNRTSLPETIKYNGETYTNDLTFANMVKTYCGKIMMGSVEPLATSQGKKAVIVKVLSSSLKGKTDLYRQPYQPTEWVYTCKK